MSDDITFCIAECNTKCFRKPSRIRDRSIPHSFADFSKNCMAYEPKDEPQIIRCPKCGRTDYIRDMEKDMGVKGSCYKYKCINCNTYIKDEPQTQLTAKCLECNNSKACKENHWDVCRYEPLGYEVTAVVGTIKDEPQTERIDAVEVVRCKDCKHRDPEDRKCDCGEFERAGCIFPVDDYYYCGYGEKK